MSGSLRGCSFALASLEEKLIGDSDVAAECGGGFSVRRVGAAFDDAAIDGLGGMTPPRRPALHRGSIEGWPARRAFSSDHAALRPAMLRR